MLSQDGHATQAKNFADDSAADPAHDEPPWSPELLDLIAERGEMWVCHDRDDADLLLRPDAGDLPALWLPIHHVRWLTPALVKPLTTIRVLLRPDVGDGFSARYWVAVKQQLEAVIDGKKTLIRLYLEAFYPTLAATWSAVQEDRERFQLNLVALHREQEDHSTETITPKRRRPEASSNGHGNGTQADTKWRPIIVSADQVQAQPIQWLWPPYLPRNMLAMLDGDPGLGKSMMLLQIATNLSRGHPFLDQTGKPTLLPDVEGPQTTLILSAEDSLEHIMIPRLERAGADRRYIKFLTGYRGVEDEEYVFDFDKPSVFVDALEEVKPVLVVIDPLVGYMGNRDINKSKDTRPLMARLGRLAERYHCTIVGVRHPGKLDQGGPLMYRGQGNIDIIGASRSGLWIQPHPMHPEVQSLLIHDKTNVGPLGRSVIFSREQGQFTWVGVSRLTEAMVTGKGPDPYAFLEAFFWLEHYMRPGLAYKTSEIEKAASEKDIGKKPLERAKKWLRIQSTQVTGGWTWTLPPLNP